MTPTEKKAAVRTDLRTVKDCESKHKIWKWIVSIAVSLIVAFPVWAISAGYRAEDLAKSLDTRLQVHESAHTERDKAIDHTLQRIETTQQKVLEKIEKILSEKP